MARRRQQKTTKKSNAFHAARLGGQRGAIPGAIRIHNTKYTPAPQHDWTYSDGTGKCHNCRKPLLEGDMLKRGTTRKQHYICMPDAYGGGKES
jgi:hypothetical protein